MRLLAGLVPVLGALAAATPVVERGANTTGGGCGGGGGGGPSCLTDDDAQRIANDWLAIFSGSPGRINTTLSADVTVYDSLINNGNLSAIATNRADYYGFVMQFTYPQDGVIKNAKYSLDGGGLMFHSCDKIAMRYIGHAECTGKFSVPAGTQITVAVNQLLSVNHRKEINVAWSEYDLFTMLKEVGAIPNPFDSSSF